MNIFSTKSDTSINKEDWFNFEKQFLEQVSLTTLGFALISLFLNILMHFNPALYIIPLISAAIFLIIYFMARFDFHILLAKWIFVATTLAVINLVWYYNYGSNGPWFFLLILLYSYLIFMMNGKQLLLLSFFLIINVITMFLYEYTHPGALGDYPNETMRLYDFYTAILMSGITAYILMSMAKKSYLTQYKKAKMADKLKSSFLANMSHEIRTPLNAIVGFSNLLADGTIKEDEKEEYITIINNSNETLLQLIDDILDVSMIEANQVQIHKEHFPVNDLMHSLFKTYQPLIKEKKGSSVTLKLKLPPDMIWITSDKIRISQVMSNLLNNAIKFTEKGSIEFGFYPEKKNLRFYVKDSGIGIVQQHQEHLFDRFYKIEEDNTKLYRGTGIGLYLCKKITELLGGTIHVISEYGKGSEFYFTIPAENITVTPIENEKQNQHYQQTEKDSSVTKATVLIIEDDINSRIYFKKILKDTGFLILEASDGKTGIKIFDNNTDIQLVLLDIRLPGISGFEILKELKKIRPNVPVIAQTAFAMAGDKEKCLKAGFDGYLSKPIQKEKLLQKIQNFLNK